MKGIGIVIIALVFGGIAFGGETCTISGNVGFQYDGDIYICLFTQKNMQNPKGQGMSYQDENNNGKVDFEN